MDIKQDTFDFICPTRMIYRPEGIDLIGKIISKDYNFKKVVLIYGGNSLKKNGYYQRIVKSFKDNDISFIEYSGIEANPDVKDINKIIKMARDFKPDLILGCGGGSVLDCAKAVAHGYYYLGNVLDFPKHIVKPLHALPIATIVTIAASGSEMSDSCVISDREHNYKGGFNVPTNYPLFSLLDPTLTYSVSKYQTAVGLVDMFSHSFERYFSKSHELEPCDDIALAIMKNIVALSQRVIENPSDYEARRAMLILGSISHDGFSNYGKNKKFVVHPAEHYLSGLYPKLTHGQGIALLLVPYLKTNHLLFKEKITKMAEVVFNEKKKITIKKGIEDLDNYLNSLPIYHSFSELPFEIKGKDIDKAIKFLKVKDC